MITSDNAMLRGAVLFNVRGSDLGSTVEAAMQKLRSEEGLLPQDISWSGAGNTRTLCVESRP